MATNNVDVGIKLNEEFQKKTLAASGVANSEGITVEAHMADKTIHLSPEQVILIASAIQNTEKGQPNGVATLGADGKIDPDQIDLTKYVTSTNVDTYDNLLTLPTTQAPVNSYVFVSDASNDETVDEGWAIYRRVASNGNASDWTKIAEKESLDITFKDYSAEIKDAKDEALKLDAAFCESVEDMKSKNLRDGAIVFMASSSD